MHPTTDVARSASIIGRSNSPRTNFSRSSRSRGLVDPGLGDAAGLHEADESVAAVLTAELVDAGVEQPVQPFVLVEVLDTPRLGDSDVTHRPRGR